MATARRTFGELFDRKDLEKKVHLRYGAKFSRRHGNPAILHHLSIKGVVTCALLCCWGATARTLQYPWT